MGISSVFTELSSVAVQTDETFTNRVSAFDIEPDGSLSNRRIWASFGAVPTGTDIENMLSQVAVASDGCCLDADNMLWIADALGNRVVHVRAGGEIVEQIEPGLGMFACMLGGDDGRTLFLYTVVHGCTRLYTVVHGCTRLYTVVHGCTRPPVFTNTPARMWMKPS